MIENPAFFKELSAQSLSADIADFTQVDTVSLNTQTLTANFGKFEKIEITGDVDDLGNRFYVSLDGNDTNVGSTPWAPLRTIKEACRRTHEALIVAGGNYQRLASRVKFTIFVSTGDYAEENPIYVPPNTSIIGDNLRRVSVFPKYTMYDLFWCDTSVYIWGFTFRGHNTPAAAACFPNLQSRTLSSIALNNLSVPNYSGFVEWRKPYVVTSPYIQGCSSITRMLTANRFSTTNQVLTSETLVRNVSAFTKNVDNLFDIFTSTLYNGATSQFVITPNTTFNPAFTSVLTNNTTLIQDEAIAYIDAQLSASNRQWGMPFITNWNSTNRNKCKRDIGYVLEAIGMDITNGNTNQTLSASREYLREDASEVRTSEQLAPTINTMEFVKKLIKDISLNPNVPLSASPLWTGCGIRVDGSLAEGFLRSFVMDSFTQFNEGGKGIHIINNGYAQLVSIFTICCTEGIHAESGGQCSINTSNCSFGLSGIVANGKSSMPVLTGTLTNIDATVFTFKDVRGTFIVPDSKYRNEGNAIGVDTRVLTTSPYNGMIFTIKGDGSTTETGSDYFYVVRQDVIKLPDINVPTLVTDRFSFAITTRPTDNKINELLALTDQQRNCEFYLRSLITTSSHTMEYIGSGVLLEKAVPGLGGIANTENEAIAGDNGAVYFTSTNQAGNFRVGEGFTIIQETGIIEGDTFKRAILSLVTPLILSLE